MSTFALKRSRNKALWPDIAPASTDRAKTRKDSSTLARRNRSRKRQRLRPITRSRPPVHASSRPLPSRNPFFFQLRNKNRSHQTTQKLVKLANGKENGTIAAWSSTNTDAAAIPLAALRCIELTKLRFFVETIAKERDREWSSSLKSREEEDFVGFIARNGLGMCVYSLS